MSAQQRAIWVVTFPLRAVWFLILTANLLVVLAACALIAAFVAYGLVLMMSYLFLPTGWTRELWQWAAQLYAQSHWFKAATIISFVLLLLPILNLWSGKDPQADAGHEDAIRLNNDLIASRQQEQRHAKPRG